MGGRPPVVGLRAAVATVLLAGLLAASPVCAQMRIPLFDTPKPKVVKKKPFRPTLPYRNPNRVTAGVSVDTIAPPKAANSEVSAVVGTSSSASVTVALSGTPAAEPTASASAGSESSEDSSSTADTETSQSNTSAEHPGGAGLSGDTNTNAAPAADEQTPASSASDASADDATGDTKADDAPDAAASAPETPAATPQADEAAAESEPQDSTPPAAETAPATESAEPVAAKAETEQTDADAADVPDASAETAEAPAEEAPAEDDAAEEAPANAAKPATASASEDEAAEATAATDASDETADKDATPAEDEAPPEAEPATASADAAPATKGTEPAATPSYKASVVLEISPPPDGAKGTRTAALTPPDAPVPDEASPPADQAADAEPDSDATNSDKAANAPDDGAAAAPAEPTEEPAEAAPPPPPPAHPIVAEIRTKLADPSVQKGINAADLKGLEEFYGTLEGPPVWVTDAGFSDKAQAVIKEIAKADDWGLEASAFDLPPANDLLASQNALADDELQLSIAVLKYARYAQVGRLTPTQASPLFDQHPALRNPKTVLSEIAAASAPDTYLTALNPQHEQFKRLQQALLKARAKAKASGRKPNNDRDVQLIVMNMERWRWLPHHLGSLYVWNNVPEFNTRVVKNGKTIYVEKTVVGQLKYATPFFSAPMRNIVFHPNWTVPPTIVNEDLAPKLQSSGGGFFGSSKNAILARYGLKVSLKGEPVDADTVDWSNVNISRYTFTQDPGPANVLGQLKFNFPNRHAIYMHDTVQPEFFDETVRSLSHGCIRVHDPDQFAALLLAQDKGWSASQVKSLLQKNETSVIPLNRLIPVHLTYFTAVVDENGNVNKLGDIYGIDNRMAAKMFDNPARFPIPASPSDLEISSRDQGRSRQGSVGLDSIISGLFGN